jgi:hypothetical protein
MDSREMGKLGGHARARKLTKKRRREIAIKASKAAVQARKRRNGKPKSKSRRSKNG